MQGFACKGVLVRLALLFGLLAAITLAGCNRKKVKQSTTAAGDKPAQSATTDTPAAQQAPGEPRYRQTFAEATRTDPPPDCRPGDATSTGKSTGKLYTEVKQLWDTVALVGDDGKPLNYRAVIATKLGNIEIDLKPDIAPNHVRNFIALARAGYYDGLVFEGVVHQTAP